MTSHRKSACDAIKPTPIDPGQRQLIPDPTGQPVAGQKFVSGLGSLKGLIQMLR